MTGSTMSSFRLLRNTAPRAKLHSDLMSQKIGSGSELTKRMKDRKHLPIIAMKLEQDRPDAVTGFVADGRYVPGCL